MKKFNLLNSVCALTLSVSVAAQCPVGQMEVAIEVTTDNWGYEGYWQLVPAGNDCGTGTIWEGGNTIQVGCTGGGEQDATAGFGYPNNTTITENIGCLDEGAYDIKYVDDWGDGGMSFNVILDDTYPVYEFEGDGAGNTFNINVTPPLEFDASITSVTSNPYQYAGDIIIEGTIFNYSATTINTIEVLYSIDGGSDVSGMLDGLSITPFTSYDFAHPVVWNETINGSYNVKLSTGQINGNDDLNTANDFHEKTITVGDPIPNIIDQYILYMEEYEVIGNSSDDIDKPTDLDFHPVLTDYQVWVINKGTEGSGGSTVTFWNAGQPDQTSLYKQDGNAWHFMSLPTAIAFSENTNFATAPGVKDANHSGGTFTGPTLWSSDMDIYAEPSGGNGSHLDMLHQSPFTMGICADRGNAFYAFCDWHNYIHFYDFQEDHGPGNDDHTNGIVRKYTDFDVEMINDDLPCHLTLDADKTWLYVIDAGNSRVIKLNTQSGTIVDDWEPSNEPLEESSSVTGCEWYEIVTSGLVEPVGIAVIDDYMLVSDHATGDIVIYDITSIPALELDRIQTGRTGLMGITLGPDGAIWFVDQDEDELVRINSTNIVAVNDLDLQNGFTIYPNPGNGNITLSLEPQFHGSVLSISVYDQLGSAAYNTTTAVEDALSIDLTNVAAGTYTLKLESEFGFATKQLIIMR